MAVKPIIIGKFPNHLSDLSKPQDFDKWFIKTWSKSGAINVPANSNLKAKAVALSRATVRQAWLSALEARSSHIRKPAYDNYKIIRAKTNKLKTALDDFTRHLQSRSEPSSVAEGQTQSLTRNVLILLNGSSLDYHGGFVTHDFEACAKFAESLLESRRLLDALDQEITKQIERHASSIQDVGTPELNAFALPFIEAAIFMTGRAVGKENIHLGNCLNDAWNLVSSEQQTGWENQIRSATKLISSAARKSLKPGFLPCLYLTEVGRQIFQGQTRINLLKGSVPS